MIPGETIASGATPKCESCDETPDLDVHRSPGGAGYYIGTYCACGPYSRESEYFSSRAIAEQALLQWRQGNLVGAR